MEKTIVTGLLVLIVFSALAHGTVEPWSVLVFEIVVSVLLLLWAAQMVVERRLRLRIPAAFWPVLALTILAIAQSLAYSGSDGLRRSLSLDVDATRGAVMMLLAMLAAMLLAANFLATDERRQTLLKFLTWYGLILALFGLIQYFGWNGRYYWIRLHEGESTPFGPFANRNHFAGYMELLLAWPAVALLQRTRPRDEKLVYAVAAAWIGLAAIFTMSRGGMIAIVAELLLIAALSGYVLRKPTEKPPHILRERFKQGGVILAILAAIVVGVLWLGAERVVNRLSPDQPETPQSSFAASRGQVWRGALKVFRAYPWTGAGLGAFDVSYAIHSGETGRDGVVTGHAHNDFLQILADAGLVGAAILIWFLWTLVRGWQRGLKSESLVQRTTALACCAALFGLLVHSLFDFNLQLPSHALLFLVLASIDTNKGVRSQ